MEILVSAEWLKSNLGCVKVLDASSHLPTSGRNADEEFARERIPSALRFDINKVADQTSDLPHMVPTSSEFAASMRTLGLNDSDQIIIYDDSSTYTSARVWWMFRLFGHEKVAVLNGGTKAWKAAGGSIETGAVTIPLPGKFSARTSFGAQVINMAAIQALMAGDQLGQLVDARPVGRFSGEVAEPRAGLRAGHIPGSRNVPLNSLIDENGFYKDIKGIRAAFEAGDIDPERPIISTCGSGVTACGLALGLALLGNEKVFVYDGSWTEWGGSDAPVETGS